jgi:type IV pilus assembly protein PilA
MNQPPAPFVPQQQAPKKGLSTGCIVLIVLAVLAVPVLGVVASVGIYGVRKYLAAAKTSEAKNTIGAITRGAQAAYEQESLGPPGAPPRHKLCGPAVAVPAAIPSRTKYLPLTSSGSDFETGDAANGWKCLKFSIANPIYYRYSYYTNDKGFVSAGLPGAPSPAAAGFEAGAQGDLDGNGVHSTFARLGNIDPTTGQLVLATQIFIMNEFE